ncbi:hypothetical protein LINGRAHAP2_LOCUS18499, partial [Linum grandiflorum]
MEFKSTRIEQQFLKSRNGNGFGSCLSLQSCGLAAEVWRRVCPTITLPNPDTPFKIWFMTLKTSHDQTTVAAAALCCWILWKGRNEAIFEGITPLAQVCVNRFTHEFSLWTMHLGSAGIHVQREDVESSHRNNQQPNDLMSRSVQRRLLCDGSFDKDVQKAGFGVIMVNPEGRVVDGVAGHLFCGTSIVAEARAVLAACILASREEGRADVWSDCKEVVDACGQEIQDCPWECSAVVASIQDILIAFPLIHVLYCSRQCVSAADRIAKQARDRTLREDWLG